MTILHTNNNNFSNNITSTKLVIVKHYHNYTLTYSNNVATSLSHYGYKMNEPLRAKLLEKEECKFAGQIS